MLKASLEEKHFIEIWSSKFKITHSTKWQCHTKFLLVIAFPKIITTVTFIITIVTVQDFIFFKRYKIFSTIKTIVNFTFPIFAKLLERLKYNRIISFLYKNKIFSEAQNGFRKGKSINTAVQSFIGSIQEVLNKRVHTIGIFIDLTKAFDVLNHKLLLEKLFYYGIRGSTNLWFRSYLTHRKQFIEICQSDSSSVRVNRYRSFGMEINQGVPQGSVLSHCCSCYT